MRFSKIYEKLASATCLIFLRKLQQYKSLKLTAMTFFGKSYKDDANENILGVTPQVAN